MKNRVLLSSQQSSEQKESLISPEEVEFSPTFGKKPTSGEWQLAKKSIITDMNSPYYVEGFKLSKKSNPLLKHSFMCINGKIVCLANGILLGQGGFGKVKEVLDDEGQRYALKIESMNKDASVLETEIMTAIGLLQGTAVRKRPKATMDKHLKRKIQDKKYQLMKLYECKEIAKVIEPKTEEERLIAAKLKNKNNRLIVAVKILEAVDMLHSIGIIHGDLKPENILIGVKDDDLYIRVIDFGLSKVTHLDHKVEHGRMEGSYGYMAPEVIRSGTFSKKSDIYALGIFLQNSLGFFKGTMGDIVQPMIYEDVDKDHIPSLQATAQAIMGLLPNDLKEKLATENRNDRAIFAATYQHYQKERNLLHRELNATAGTKKLIEALQEVVIRYEANLKGREVVGIIHMHSKSSLVEAQELIRELTDKPYIEALGILNTFLKTYSGGKSEHSLKTLIAEEVSKLSLPGMDAFLKKEEEHSQFEHKLDARLKQLQASFKFYSNDPCFSPRTEDAKESPQIEQEEKQEPEDDKKNISL